MINRLVDWREFIGGFSKLGLLGFGGPPAHVVMMRQRWVATGHVEVDEFNDAFAAVSLLPGPASTQLALWMGWRLRGYVGLVAAGALFITPAVVLVLFLSWLVLGEGHPVWINAAVLGAAAVVPAIALRAGRDLFVGYGFGTLTTQRRYRLVLFSVVGFVTCLSVPSAIPISMIVCGFGEVLATGQASKRAAVFIGIGSTKTALVWMSLKVGALSFGGGFVIVPIMRGDAVTAQHWMTASAFLTAVAIGQLTPGPVVATVAAVGYAAGGFRYGLLAAIVAFVPSFVFVALGARHIVELRQRPNIRAFLDGAGPVATGAIVASAFMLARSCAHAWQWPILFGALIAIVVFRQSTTLWLIAGAGAGLLLGLFAHVAV